MGAPLWGAFLLHCAHLPLCTLALTLPWGMGILDPDPVMDRFPPVTSTRSQGWGGDGAGPWVGE